MQISEYMPGPCFACMCVCIWDEDLGGEAGETCLYTKSIVLEYSFIHDFKQSFFLFFSPVCRIFQNHDLIAALLKLTFLASCVSHLFVPRMSFYYLFFMH